VAAPLWAVPARAAAAPWGWSAPLLLADGASEPAVVLTGEGGAAAVWGSELDDRLGVEGSVRVDGKWKQPMMLATDALEPSIAMSGEGQAIAVWVGSRGVEAAQTTPAGGWTPVPPIPRSAGASAPEVATDSAGRVTVVWREPGPGHTAIDVATHAPDGGWSAARSLSRPGGTTYSPHVAVDPDGAAVAIWRRTDGEKSVVEAATRAAAGRWSAPVDLSTKGQNAVAPAVAIDQTGQAVAVWDRFDGAHQIVQAAVRPPHGSWSRPTDLSAKGRNAEAPQVAISPTGEAVATWERFTGKVERVQAATRSLRGGWSPPRNISAAAHSSHEPHLAIDGEGLTRVVWVTTAASGPAVEEASRASGGWSAPVRLASGPGRRREPTIATAAGGEAVALWGGAGLFAAFRLAAPPSS
jgi:hypothetical protein